MARILAFSGNEDTLERLEGVFLRAGHEVTAKVIAREASTRDMTDVVERHEPDVIVYDVAPPFDGSMRAWRQLAEQPGVRHRPFVLTTSSPRLPLGRHEETRVVVLREPFTLDQLLFAVEHAPRPGER